MRAQITPTGYKYSSTPQTIDPDLQHASNDIPLVRPNFPHIQTGWYGICAALALGTWLVWRLAFRCGRWAIRWHVMQIRRLLACRNRSATSTWPWFQMTDLPMAPCLTSTRASSIELPDFPGTS